MKLDEFKIGQSFRTKSFKVTKEEIIKFAGEFDPQYMHVNEEKTKEGRFKGIIASGIHTLAISFKLWVEEEKYGEDVIAGTEMNHIKFLKAVFPGDELYTIVKVLEKKQNRSATGILTVLLSTYNDKEEEVFEGELSVLIKQ
ncbi:MaoC family dehydratase [Niallia circulans]|uniref:MaoC family dehydratase n=1 Tax=Niallia circulans TaxID=1397 RepID=UPI001F2CEF12|nr:MaoC family dehydratase [Niallia circulans]MCF2648947.1 MaoC family dehydratase [Niallia circulans]